MNNDCSDGVRSLVEGRGREDVGGRMREEEDMMLPPRLRYLIDGRSAGKSEPEITVDISYFRVQNPITHSRIKARLFLGI